MNNNSGLYFIVGGLCVVVVIGVFLFFGGHLGAHRGFDRDRVDHERGHVEIEHRDLDHRP